MLLLLALLPAVVSPANATDRTEFTCSSMCQVIIGKTVGPITSVRLSDPHNEYLAYIRKFPLLFEVTMKPWGPEGRVLMQLVFNEKDERQPIWIEDGNGGERDRVYYGLQRGPTFAEIDSAGLTQDGQLVRLHVSDGETWAHVLWNTTKGTLTWEDGIIDVEWDPLPPGPAVLIRREKQ